jgi:hypothetical protein
MLAGWFGFCAYDKDGVQLPAYRVWEISLDAAYARISALMPGSQIVHAQDLRGTQHGDTVPPGANIGDIESDGSWAIPNWPPQG